MVKSRNLGLRMAGKSLIIQRNGLPVDDILDDVESSTTSLPHDIQSASYNLDTCWKVDPELKYLTKAVDIFKRFLYTDILKVVILYRLENGSYSSRPSIRQVYFCRTTISSFRIDSYHWTTKIPSL